LLNQIKTINRINIKLNAKAILNLKLSQKLSPQQIQLMKLIQLPTQVSSNNVYLKKWTKTQPWKGKEEEEMKRTNSKMKITYESWIRQWIEALDINGRISEQHDTPDYKTQATIIVMMTKNVNIH
jgi:RNA polymerase sigma-54 factor